ncbi:unnamed protein product [Penicillium salamii]|uniref:GTP cyclohydrolase 1 n=1 Tax=Penicillium salamii TaxID=1612424 RepID=A0A9W4IVP6_9EURO|nr:unnamed protein product [Penicillium salamii]CAG8002528.1 unnamed protein product [Penicillium salamii]CAG8045304.1 unnamed protein product [Penicillium salamii]CAG8066688.1 unnamed protein product [Penicillium salamii]CAG8223898.1 unnamed protein product [Penicillium salamii]
MKLKNEPNLDQDLATYPVTPTQPRHKKAAVWVSGLETPEPIVDSTDNLSNATQDEGILEPHSKTASLLTTSFNVVSARNHGITSRLDVKSDQPAESDSEREKSQTKRLTAAVHTIIECIGEDLDREGLRDTPERYAKAMLHFTSGYEENTQDLINGAIFKEDCDELVIVRDIHVSSLCEHHLVPFIGKMDIGYIPNGRVLGLSKFARLAEVFSRRLQNQERLTKQVASCIFELLNPQGIAVVMEASHMCMVMRGVEKVGSTTITSCMLGSMRSNGKAREEFLTLLRRG